ncbi:MAG: ABC transporter permease subunit [Thermoplasmata archaeon]
MNRDISAIKTLAMDSIRSTVLGKRVYVPIIITIFLVVVMFYGSRENGSLGTGVNMMDSLVISFFSVLLAMVYGTSIIRSDIEDRSIINVLTAPVHRSLTFLTYYISAFVSVSFVMVFITTAAYLSYFFPTGLTWFRFDYFISFLWLILLSSLVYTALFVTMGLIVKKPVYLGLFYVFVWEGFVGELSGRIGEFTINHFILSLGSNFFEHGNISEYSGASTGASLLVLMILWAVLLALGTYLFTKKELY